MDFNHIWITGDIHGNCTDISKKMKGLASRDDLIILLGDVGANFDNGAHDAFVKWELSRLPGTKLCIHGNHERRPDGDGIIWEYQELDWNGGIVFQEEGFPNILFAKDGSRFNINGREFLVIGGGYSIDKAMRKEGISWFPGEQLNNEEKRIIWDSIEAHGFKEDIILSHTCPFNDRPIDRMFVSVDQSQVDNSMEQYLQDIKSNTAYKEWYCGHWHIDRTTPDIQFMYRGIEEII